MDPGNFSSQKDHFVMMIASNFSFERMKLIDLFLFLSFDANLTDE